MKKKTRSNAGRKQRFPTNRQWRPQAATAGQASILKQKTRDVPSSYLQLDKADTIPFSLAPSPLPFVAFLSIHYLD